jgi:hypothetical protein
MMEFHPKRTIGLCVTGKIMHAITISFVISIVEVEGKQVQDG